LVCLLLQVHALEYLSELCHLVEAVFSQALKDKANKEVEYQNDPEYVKLVVEINQPLVELVCKVE
jgi:hypothetical protein